MKTNTDFFDDIREKKIKKNKKPINLRYKLL